MGHREQMRHEHIRRALGDRVVRRQRPAGATDRRRPHRALPQARVFCLLQKARVAVHGAVAATGAANRDQRHIVGVHVLVVGELEKLRERIGAVRRHVDAPLVDRGLLFIVQLTGATHTRIPLELRERLCVLVVVRDQAAQVRHVVPPQPPPLEQWDSRQTHGRRQTQRDLRGREQERKAPLLPPKAQARRLGGWWRACDRGAVRRGRRLRRRRRCAAFAPRRTRQQRLHTPPRRQAMPTLGRLIPRPWAIRIQPRRQRPRSK